MDDNDTVLIDCATLAAVCEIFSLPSAARRSSRSRAVEAERTAEAADRRRRLLPARLGGGGDRRATVASSTSRPPGAEPHDLELSPRDVERDPRRGRRPLRGGGFQPARRGRRRATATVRSLDVRAEASATRTSGSTPSASPRSPRAIGDELDRAGGGRRRSASAPRGARPRLPRRGSPVCDRRAIVTRTRPSATSPSATGSARSRSPGSRRRPSRRRAHSSALVDEVRATRGDDGLHRAARLAAPRRDGRARGGRRGRRCSTRSRA